MTRARYCREAVVTYRRDRTDQPATQIVGSREAHAVARSAIPDGPQERFVVIALDAKNRTIGWTTVGMGGVASCGVVMSDCFRFPLLVGAAAIVCSHNHPSGLAEPSADDLALTKRLVEAGQLLGIRVLDHLVLGAGDQYVSMLDRGLMP